MPSKYTVRTIYHINIKSYGFTRVPTDQIQLYVKFRIILFLFSTLVFIIYYLLFIIYYLLFIIYYHRASIIGTSCYPVPCLVLNILLCIIIIVVVVVVVVVIIIIIYV